MRPSTISAAAVGAIIATLLLCAAWTFGDDRPYRLTGGCPTVTVQPL